MKKGDKVIITKLYRGEKLLLEGEKEVKVTRKIRNRAFEFEPNIKGSSIISSDHGDTYKLPNPFGKLIIHTPDKEDWIKVCEKIERKSGLVWGRLEKSEPTKFEHWDEYKEDSAIEINERLGYVSLMWYKNNYPSNTFTTAKEFLGEEFVGELSGAKVYVNSNLNIKEKTMSIVKNALMSKESKAVRELGLGENKSNLNREGLMEYLEFLWAKADNKSEFLKLLVEKNKES